MEDQVRQALVAIEEAAARAPMSLEEHVAVKRAVAVVMRALTPAAPESHLPEQEKA